MSQSAIIKKILNIKEICDVSKMHDAPVNFILTEYEDVNGRNQEWNYRSVIGQMNYNPGTTIPDILFTMHQCEKYIINPKTFS